MCALVTGGQTCALPIVRLAGRAAIEAEAAGPPRYHLPQQRRWGDLIKAALEGVPDNACAEVLYFCDYWLGLKGDGPLPPCEKLDPLDFRSEEHTSELQSLMRISYAVFCLKKKKKRYRKMKKKVTNSKNITKRERYTKRMNESIGNITTESIKQHNHTHT